MKAGEFPIDLEFGARVGLPRAGGRSFFGLRFQDYDERDVTLQTSGDPVAILPLPKEGKPDDFTGAVGQFELGTFQLPAEATTGEPVSIRVAVTGSGNFDRLPAPKLKPSGSWKSYTAKSQFDPSDAVHFSGRKIFEFAAVPQKAGPQKVQLGFSYFDPGKGSYQRLASPEMHLVIKGEDIVPVEPIAVNDSATDRKADSPESSIPQGFSPIRTWNTGKGTLHPVFAQTSLALGVSTAGLGVVVGLTLAFFRRRRENPDLRRKNRLTAQKDEALTRAKAAMGAEDAVSFFYAGRQAIQAELAMRWGCAPDGITLTELKDRLPADSKASVFFTEADSIAYANGGSYTKKEMKQWFRALGQTLNESAVSRSDRAYAQPQVLTAITLLGIFALTLNARADWKEGVGAFGGGDYQRAITAFQAEISKSGPSASLLYNLGNSHYELAEFGPAILAYERALLLNPRARDIRTNLKFAREAALTFEESEPKGWRRAFLWLSRNEAGWLAIFAGLLLSSALICWGNLGWLRPWMKPAVISSVVVALVLLVVAWASLKLHANGMNRGVAVAERTPIRLSPFPTADSIGFLTPGRRVVINKTHEEFVHLETVAGDLVGWANSSDV